jgi:hypothetical protein
MPPRQTEIDPFGEKGVPPLPWRYTHVMRYHIG